MEVVLLVIYGVLGAAGWEGIKRLAQARRDRDLQRRYALSGTYVGSFDDDDSRAHESGDRVETVTLKQAGSRVSGTSKVTSEGDDRAWAFDGVVGAEGRIACWYRSAKPGDLGLGTFFLERDHFDSGHYSGSWTGYAPGVHKVDSGTYEWRRQAATRHDVRPRVGAR